MSDEATPVAERSIVERRQLLRFLLRLGHLLLATGAPVGLVETTLRKLARVYRIEHFNALALPTVVFVNSAEEDSLQIEFTSEQGLVLRFDQIEAVYELARDADDRVRFEIHLGGDGFRRERGELEVSDSNDTEGAAARPTQTFVRRDRISMVRRISSSRPITGSSLPSARASAASRRRSA